MAKIIITIEDADKDLVNYKSECETPEETKEDGQPTLALQMAGIIIQQMMALNIENKVK